MTCNIVKPLDQTIGSNGNSKTVFNPMVDGVRWTERYSEQIEKYWKHTPNWLRQVLVFIAIFVLASGVQGTGTKANIFSLKLRATMKT